MLGCATRLDLRDTRRIQRYVCGPDLGSGEGIRFKVLTYVKGNFVDSPIDNVLVAGPGAGVTDASVRTDGECTGWGRDCKQCFAQAWLASPQTRGRYSEDSCQTTASSGCS